ncbi:MAG: purine-nucleoside phosphorylase [Clostridium sp.]|nr:purine-nucleoside phosphorylase [Prevotella sp.]MCM1428191.1 purine-nucleoside phosphorylase [Clostridium sp.]MCM1475922.1 purine-nucleoside phosphorylase [Muribaculaceae bacterium]
MLNTIRNTADFIRGQVGEMPKIAIILGTGLGDLVNYIDIKKELNYKDIPNFPVSTVEGHSGKLIFGYLGGKYVMAMSGRFHYYEGYDMKQVTFPVRVMKEVGVETLFVSNASGGMNKEFVVGDVMIITDHINLFPENPLRGKNFEELGPRFPAMTEAYSHRLIKMADDIAAEDNTRIMHGVYVGTPGPTFETPAEYEYFRVIGGDCVGMSTVPEVIVANHAGMEVFGVSVITDLGGKDITIAPSHEEVQLAAVKAQPVMTRLITEMIQRM